MFIPPRAALCILACVLALVTTPARADRITVFAAASLRTALEEIAADFEKGHPHEILLSFAGSSVLARQISLGAPAQVFVSASQDWMDHLEAQGFAERDTRFDLAGNRLVLIAAGSSAPGIRLNHDTDLAGMIGDRRLAMALVDAVPAGVYGKEALAHFGLWDTLAPRVAQTDNVRAALALVAAGAAPFGIVYATDALAEPRVSVVATFPEESHTPVIYPAVAVTDRDSAAVRSFLDYLRSPQADKILTRLGFVAMTE
ncbi:molybdate ABC transporter substrate-binding protein [uncultured Roseobacter sp.]|uniref:molybdate ABC transporter substrate-binding protein n=1 Tax=uncultured Roseobacter sp. TaxID=114847 RepID=UPI00261967EB|nr:molybdate ABC transporter substrate-binding protein [uncultured Roseobacter sp.]